jgi:hypothetical protein
LGEREEAEVATMKMLKASRMDAAVGDEVDEVVVVIVGEREEAKVATMKMLKASRMDAAVGDEVDEVVVVIVGGEGGGRGGNNENVEAQQNGRGRGGRS